MHVYLPGWSLPFYLLIEYAVYLIVFEVITFCAAGYSARLNNRFNFMIIVLIFAYLYNGVL